MLNEQILTAAAEAIEAESPICAEWDALAQTADTIEDFIAAHGQPSYSSVADDSDMVVFVWEKGRKTLAVVDCGEARAALFM